MRLRRLVPLVTMLALAAAACSSSGSSKAAPAVETTSTRSAPSTTGPLPDLGPASVGRFTGPRSPVQCSAPTSVELHWDTPVTATVDLRIDRGDVFATYPGGKGDYLVPLTCDGRAQTYELTVHGTDGSTATKTLTIEERRSG